MMRNKGGFTLVEMLVTISVTLILSGILIGYSREAGKHLVLVNNQAKLVSLIARAKSLSTATFFEGTLPLNPGDPRICGYGVHVDTVSGEIFIFRDLAVDCVMNGDNRFGSGDIPLTGQLNVFELTPQVTQFASDMTLDDIIFIPPDPTIIINGDTSLKEAMISIEVKDGSSKSIIKINNAGRISTK
ncbi:MAG: hypothetical protein A3E61_02375 [Candidatus Colwellbacteria bacterium RIFCSPHIGHO2_12_FULL_43_12]|uniref:General secretion pathway GspH domain-containing protein n=3 Tax=Candidatus Colwelliibacteriota TaxID=1817904 RepID=A0A1G1Z606_9BACT|nr:MAG: hypothetical protein A3E61_02375 [Candidatus Colwellbacteria bacterium RIFCSPHIGHO2_12_FULL_43_12]